MVLEDFIFCILMLTLNDLSKHDIKIVTGVNVFLITVPYLSRVISGNDDNVKT